SRTVIDSDHMIGVLSRLAHDVATERGDVVTRDHTTNDRRRPRLWRAYGGTRSNTYARAGNWHLTPPGLVEEAEAALQLDKHALRRRQRGKREPQFSLPAIPGESRPRDDGPRSSLAHVDFLRPRRKS